MDYALDAIAKNILLNSRSRICSTRNIYNLKLTFLFFTDYKVKVQIPISSLFLGRDHPLSTQEPQHFCPVRQLAINMIWSWA